MNMELTENTSIYSPEFKDLPKKVLGLIFKGFTPVKRQQLRLVSHLWKSVIDDIPLEIVITQANHENFFRCPSAWSVDIQNLTTEYVGPIHFGGSVRYVQFTGKVLSSNVYSILHQCPQIEALRFSSLKQVLGIEGTDTIKLPDLTTLEITVRPDQETFTSDDIIIISCLRQILFSSLKTILVTTGNQYEGLEEDTDDEYNSDRESSYDGESRAFTMSRITPFESTGGLDSSSDAPSLVIRLEDEIGESSERESPSNPLVTFVPLEPNPSEQSNSETPHELPPTTGGQPSNNLHVLINRITEFAGASVSSPDQGSLSSDAATSTSETSSNASRHVRYNISEFEARLFYANLELLVQRASDTEVNLILNDSVSQTGPGVVSNLYFESSGATASTKHTAFFELVRNNCKTLKNLYVKTRTDFMCFGNLSGFSKDLTKVQFEELDYSFGRTEMCYEHTLLRAQTKLTKVRMHILDDLWGHLMTAVENSRDTLLELDVKIISVTEDRVDISSITKCSNLKALKLLHFFEKESLCKLPNSLNRLILNGPVSYQDMETWTTLLPELAELTLLLNLRGGRIDVELYRKFIKMPKTAKLTFIQCPMDLTEIKKYIDNHLSSQRGFRFWINGPKDISEVPAIQYVHTVIKPGEFDRDLVQL